MKATWFVAAFILGLLGASSATALQERASDPAAVLAEARGLVNRGQPAAAIQKLLPLARGDPRVAQLLGVAYYQTDDPLRAIELLTPVADAMPSGSLEEREAHQVLGLARLFGVAPGSAGAHLLAAQMMVRLEFEDMARAELEAAIAKDPRIPQARYLLAQSAIFRARFEEATQLLEKELEVNPGNAMAFYRLGEALSRQNKWDEAIAALQKSIWLQPYFSGPYIVLGRAYMKKGQPATAEGLLRRALQYDPNNKSAHYLLGQLLQQAGREDEARRELEIAERLQGEPERR